MLGELSQFEIKDSVAIIPEGTTTISAQSFYGCEELQSAVIPEGVTMIAHGAFSRCKELQSVVIPEGVVDIDYGAFAMCYALRSITFPASLKRIAHNAIALCKSLEEITFNGRVEVEEGCYVFSRINEWGNLKAIKVSATDVEFYKEHLPQVVRHLVIKK